MSSTTRCQARHDVKHDSMSSTTRCQARLDVKHDILKCMSRVETVSSRSVPQSWRRQQQVCREGISCRFENNSTAKRVSRKINSWLHLKTGWNVYLNRMPIAQNPMMNSSWNGRVSRRKIHSNSILGVRGQPQFNETLVQFSWLLNEISFVQKYTKQ